MAMLQIVILLLTYSFVKSQTDYCQLPCSSGTNLVTHTACLRQNVNCGPGPACGSAYTLIELTQADRQAILDRHNFYRNKVASGAELRGPQPTAANMKAFSYNRELEAIAKCWTNGCEYKHDQCRRTANYSWVGQNIGMVTYTNQLGDYVSVYNWIIDLFYEEVKDMDPAWVSSYQQFPKVVGHYTAQVWANTKEIGCGMTHWQKNATTNIYFIACNYGPGGNYLNQPVYQIGTPASNCAGQAVNSRYPALCGPDILN